MTKNAPPLLAAAAVLAIAAVIAAGLATRSSAQSVMADGTPSATPSQTLDPDPLPETDAVMPSPNPTGSLGPTPTPIPEPVLPAVPADTALPMPLDPYMTSMADIHTIDLARDAAAAQCMHALGFSAWTAGVVRSWSAEDYLEADVLEPVDGAVAAGSGYPRQQPDPAVAAEAAEPEDQRAATAAEMQAFSGTADRTASGADIPEGGCEVSGEAQVYGGEGTLDADPRLLADDASFLALEHTRVKQAMNDWVTCMTGKGYAYDSPMSARNDPAWAAREGSEPATAREKQVAAADADCAAGSNLYPTYRAAKRAYEQIMLDDRRQKLSESMGVFDGWVRRAEAVLAAR
jgi:hypothetical protein